LAVSLDPQLALSPGHVGEGFPVDLFFCVFFFSFFFFSALDSADRDPLALQDLFFSFH